MAKIPLKDAKSRMIRALIEKPENVNVRLAVQSIIRQGRAEKWTRPQYKDAVLRFLKDFTDDIERKFLEREGRTIKFTDTDREHAAGRILRMGFMV